VSSEGSAEKRDNGSNGDGVNEENRKEKQNVKDKGGR